MRIFTNMQAPIVTALSSFGMSGRLFHAPFIQAHPAFKLAGAWQRNSNSIEEQFPEAVRYKAFEEILQHPDIELVVVNTPTSTHFELAKAALLAGKHVLVEKAFTTNLKEALELQQLAAEKKRVLTVFQNRRYDSDFKLVQSVVEEQPAGAWLEGCIRFERYKPALSPKTHKETPTPGAGLWMDLGPHILDQALQLFGKPQSVSAEMRQFRPGTQVDDWFQVLLHYSNKCITLKGSLLVKDPMPAYQFHGMNGSFTKSRADVQETQLLTGMSPLHEFYGVEPDTEAGKLVLFNNGHDLVRTIPAPKGNYLQFYDELAQAIRHNATAPVTMQQAADVMQLLELVPIAVKSGIQHL